jgi:hypothetical protein
VVVHVRAVTKTRSVTRIETRVLSRTRTVVQMVPALAASAAATATAIPVPAKAATHDGVTVTARPGVRPIDANVRTIKALVAQQRLTTTGRDTGGHREWTIVPENVYTETRICWSCGSGLWSKQTGPRSFTCLWCMRAWTDQPVPEPEMAR